MKRLLLCAVLLVAGCKASTAPLPAGAINTFDADTFRTLADTRAAVSQIQKDVTAGQATLSSTQKAFVNQVITDVNEADVLYQSYHAALSAAPTSNPSTTALAAATAKVETDFGQLTTLTQK
jgi:hypothetical protein